MTIYWYKSCSICGQGRLYIWKDITHERLYLHCEECEWGWLNPLDANDRDKAFLTIDMDFESESVDIDTIRMYGWEEYAQHSYEE